MNYCRIKLPLGVGKQSKGTPERYCVAVATCRDLYYLLPKVQRLAAPTPNSSLFTRPPLECALHQILVQSQKATAVFS